MIESTVSVRESIRGAYGTTENNSDPLSCEVDNNAINKTAAFGGELVILYRSAK